MGENIKKKEGKQDARSGMEKKRKILYLIVGGCLLFVALVACGCMIFLKNSHLTVSFNTDGGTPQIENMKVKKGESIDLPEVTKENNIFDGWYDGEERLIQKKYTVTKNVTLLAKWIEKEEGEETKTYTITFNSNGGSEVAPMDVECGKTLTLPENPTKDGFNFVHWHDTHETPILNEALLGCEDVTLYAKWEEVKKDTKSNNQQSQSISVVEAEGIFVSPTDLTVGRGKSAQLTATVYPENTANKQVSWSSSNPNVAKVTNGRVEGVSRGSAVITARTANGKEARSNVTVNVPVESVNITPNGSTTLAYHGTNKSVRLNVTVNPSDADAANAISINAPDFSGAQACGYINYMNGNKMMDVVTRDPSSTYCYTGVRSYPIEACAGGVCSTVRISFEGRLAVSKAGNDGTGSGLTYTYPKGSTLKLSCSVPADWIPESLAYFVNPVETKTTFQADIKLEAPYPQGTGLKLKTDGGQDVRVVITVTPN